MRHQTSYHMLTRKIRRWRYLAPLALVIGLAGCQAGGKSTPPAAPPTPVSVITVTAEDVPIYQEFAAQTYARDLVEVRGRVAGNVEKRLFQVGSDVRAGDLLYVLDLRPYQAAVDKSKGDVEQSEANAEFARQQVSLLQAQADLAQARANMMKARQDVDRLKPLVKEDAASQQDLDNAIASLKANEASVTAREANVLQIKLSSKAQLDTSRAQVVSNRALLRTAELNLEYATITAPISGRIGDSLVQVGGLVSPTAAQPLTTIVPLDPIWVRFKLSEAEYFQFKKHKALTGEANTPLQLVLADGAVHPHQGRIENAVNQVDPKTGTLELQATFVNPEKSILPGQYGRVRVSIEDRKQALLVPQRAVTEMQGLQSIFTVGPDNKVLARGVSMGERVGDRWVVLQGLKNGDRVIVEGLQKVRPGSLVKPEAYMPLKTKTVSQVR